MAAGWRGDRGISLFEVMLVLIVSMALVAGLAPTVSAVLADARAARAQTDMTTIKLAIDAFKASGFTIFTNDGTQTVANQVAFLYSDGDVPNVDTAATWRNTTANNTNDFLEEHLVSNLFNGGAAYPVPPGVNPRWRGTYLNAPIDPDPWGNRYAVNVQFLGASGNDVVVYSAGPDEGVDTTATLPAWAPVDDDLFFLVEA